MGTGTTSTPGSATSTRPAACSTARHPLPATCDEDGLPVEDGSGSSPCIIRADAENPPDWSQAPEEPPGYALVPGEYPFFMGLTMDFLGYMVPTFDFQTSHSGCFIHDEKLPARQEFLVT